MIYRRDIDGMRALAVLAVVLCHAGVPGFAGGFIGVDLFFVISGYLICGILARELAAGEFSLISFYERRVRRILPPLFLVIAACFMAGWWFLPPPAYADLARSALPATLFFSNLHFRQETGDYFAIDSEFAPLLHTWSLSVEEQFYLLIPVGMWLAWRIDRRLLLPGAMLATLASFAWSVRLVDTLPSGAFFLIQSRAWELGVGAVLALGLGRVPLPRWLAEVMSAAGLLAIVFGTVTYDANTAFPGIAALAPVLGAAGLIWAGTHHRPLVTRLLSLAPFVWIGLISYALYLWHWPMLVFARHLQVSTSLPVLWTAVTLAMSVLLAWASTRLVERPLRRRGASAALSRRAIFAAAALAAAAIIAFGWYAQKQEGFWSRSPELREMVAETSHDIGIDRTCRDETFSEGNLCRIGSAEAASPTVLVWGDSHAAALVPGMDLLLTERGLAGTAIVPTGCPPLPGFSRQRGDRVVDCPAIIDAAFARLSQQAPDLQTVVLAARWSSHLTQQQGEGGNRPYDPLLDAATGEPLPRQQAAARIEAELAAVTDGLLAAGYRVVIVADVPEMPRHVPNLLLGASYGSPVPFAPLPLALARQRHGDALAMLARVAERPGVTLVDPVEEMCGQACPVMVEGHLLYRDDNHLSAYGSELFVPLMLEDVEL